MGGREGFQYQRLGSRLFYSCRGKTSWESIRGRSSGKDASRVETTGGYNKDCDWIITPMRYDELGTREQRCPVCGGSGEDAIKESSRVKGRGEREKAIKLLREPQKRERSGKPDFQAGPKIALLEEGL